MLTKQIITKEFYDEQGRLTRKIIEENHFDDTTPLEPKWSEYPNDWPPTPISESTPTPISVTTAHTPDTGRAAYPDLNQVSTTSGTSAPPPATLTGRLKR